MQETTQLMIMIIIAYLITINGLTCSMDKSSSSLRQSSENRPRQVDSKALLGNEGRVVILHDGQLYILRQTQAGKLILTK